METARNDTADRFGQVPPPEGVMPDFDHPKDAGWKLNIIVLAICNALVTIFFLLRCYVKIFVNRRINLADCKGTPFVLQTYELTSPLRGMSDGMGTPSADLKPGRPSDGYRC